VFYWKLTHKYFCHINLHKKPHFHAKYTDSEASIDLDGEIVSGTIPYKQTKHVVAWADFHRDELSALWGLMCTDKQEYIIKGLE